VAGHLDGVAHHLVVPRSLGRVQLVAVGAQRTEGEAAGGDLLRELGPGLRGRDERGQVGVRGFGPVPRGDLDRAEPVVLRQVESTFEREVTDRVRDQPDLHRCPSGDPTTRDRVWL
jgi:hypothetical protein